MKRRAGIVAHTMHVFVLGANSDADPRFTGGGLSWYQLVRIGLAEMTGEPVRLSGAGFRPHGPGAADFAERVVREANAEMVLVPMGTFAFTFGLVSVRVRRLFGKRAAEWYKRFEDGFDDTTRRRTGGALRLNMLVRRVFRATIGTEPMASEEEVRACYREVLRRLARMEDLEVTLIAMPGHGALHRRGAAEKRRRMYAELQPEAQRLHFGWVDTASAFSAHPDPAALQAADKLHFTSAGNRVMADAVLAVLEARGARRACEPVQPASSRLALPG
jgi:hypothetical protein